MSWFFPHCIISMIEIKDHKGFTSWPNINRYKLSFFRDLAYYASAQRALPVEKIGKNKPG